MLSLYIAAETPLHRLPAGHKLLIVVVAGTGQFLISSWVALLAALLAVTGLYALARVPPRIAIRHTTPILPFLAVLAGTQVLLTTWEQAVVVCLRVLSVVLLANLVSLTTRTSAIIAVIEKVVARIPRHGQAMAPQIGILVAMTLRFIPLIKQEADDIRAAQQARGNSHGMLPLLLPLLIKTLRLADQVSEALDARGVIADRKTENARPQP
jgi:biotin transport system permease protein